MKKLFYYIFLTALCTIAFAKEELQIVDCGGDDAIIKVAGIVDEKKTGPIDDRSVLQINFTSSKDTTEQDPFDIDMKFQIKKKIAFWFVEVPGWVMDRIGKNIHDNQTKYMGNSVFRIKCLFFKMYGTCLPKKGDYIEMAVMKPVLEGAKKLGWFGRKAGSGWYKVRIEAKTVNNKENVFCVDMTFNVNL